MISEYNPLVLQFSILVPFLCGASLIAFRNTKKDTQRNTLLLGCLGPAAAAIWLFIQYFMATPTATGYYFTSQINTGLEGLGISLKLGLNGIALPLYVLAGIVGAAAGLYALQTAKPEFRNYYWGLLLIMLSGLMGTFASIDIFFFYLFHEFALIPSFMLILLWGGNGARRIALEMTVYLTVGALLSLLGLIAIYYNSPAQSFDLIALKHYMSDAFLTGKYENQIFGLLLFGFGILVSLFPFHSWAPKTYATAPAPAAMLHAGVLKKFGLYGLIQIAAPLIPEGAMHWGNLLIVLALCNIIVIGLIATIQTNLKYMVGYSSVMHMGYCFLGIFTLSVTGIGGTIMLMFAHGLSVALLLMLSTVIAKRTNAMDMAKIGGLCTQAPVLSVFFIMAILANIGLPGFANFWGEFTVFISLWQMNPWVCAIAALGIVISAVYGLRAVAKIFYGKPSQDFEEWMKEHKVSDINWAERLPALILIAALLVAGFMPRLLTGPIQTTLAFEESIYEDVYAQADTYFNYKR